MEHDYIYVGCDCYSAEHFVKLSVLDDEEVKDYLFVEIGAFTPTWIDRIRAAVLLLSGREYNYGSVILTYEEAGKLSDYLTYRVSKK